MFVSLACGKTLSSFHSKVVAIWKRNLTEAGRLHQEKGKFLASGIHKLCWKMFQKLLVKGQQLLVLFNSTVSCSHEQKRWRYFNSSSFQKKQKYYPWQRWTWCPVKTVLVRSNPKPKTLERLSINILLDNSTLCLRSKICRLQLFLMGLSSWAEATFQNCHCFFTFPKTNEANSLLGFS